MSVMITTSLGDIVIDLHTDRCPLTTKNFLKLCKIKYFNGCLFHTIQKDFTAQTGDPTGKGNGGDSIYKYLYGDQARFFGDEIHQDLKHSKTGTVAMATAGENLNASQFYFTLRDDLDYLDGKHTVFGEVAEGLETLTRINEAYVDEKGRPFKNIRIKHTYILDDPFDDPAELASLIPDASPDRPSAEIVDEVRLEDDWVPMDEQVGAGELEEIIRQKDAHSSAVVLESIGDIPDADMKPPENVLFVCKLNPVTEDEDLNTIFSRFGTVVSAEVIRDFKTGDSLNYAFIEFETNEACEQAYFKMDNALIDDRRIHVDFSQSVSKLWSQYRRKEHQTGQGKGCFKCGSLDHMAKECTGDPNVIPNPKYVLKDGNTQRGERNENYEMVFEGDNTDGSEREKRRGERDSDKDPKKRKVDRPSENDTRHQVQDKKDIRSDQSRRDDRIRGRDREDESYRGSRHGGSRRHEHEEYEKERSSRDKGHVDRRNEQHQERRNYKNDGVRDRDYRSTERVESDRKNKGDDRDYKITEKEGDRRSERDRDYRRSTDKGEDRTTENDRDYRKTDRGNRKSETDRDHGRTDRGGDRKSETDRDYRRTDKGGDRKTESDRGNKESEERRRKDRDDRKHSSGEAGRRERDTR